MASGELKDLPGRTTLDTRLYDKAFNIAKYPKYDGYQKALASIVYIFLHKKSSCFNTSGGVVKNEIMSKQKIR